MGHVLSVEKTGGFIKVVTTEAEIEDVDKDDLIGSAIRSVNGKINTIDISVYYVNKTHMHKVVKLKEKREYTCTTTSNGIKLSSIMGVDIVKAVTEKEQVFVAKAVYDWIRHPEKFPKINQKLKGKDDFHPVFEIPLGSLPFGILIRLSPVFSVDFGIYGDVEALWWLSSSRTT